MRALLTAFGPYLGRDQNQSQVVLEHCLRRLPEPWRAQLLPVNLVQLRALVAANARAADVGVWLALGESGLDGPPVLETVARNRYDFSADAPSAGGAELHGHLAADGPEEISVRIPALELAATLHEQSHAIELSAQAGSHCCNGLLYLATRALAAPVLFLHLPRRPAEAPAQARLVLDALSWLGSRSLSAVGR